MTHRDPWLTRICLGWLAAVPLWAVWEAVFYRGLYRWLCERQLDHHGQYEVALTAIIPTLVLITPALALLMRQERALPSAIAQPPSVRVAEAMAFRFLTRTACLGAVIGVGAWIWASRIPGAWPPPVEVNLALLGDRPPPAISVILLGGADSGRMVAKSIKSHQSVYAPVTGFGAKDQPMRFFVSAYVEPYSASARASMFPGHRFKGILVENGLPIDMERALTRLGVRIASPYYVLTKGSGGPRINYYIACGAGLGISGIASLALMIGLVARRRRDNIGT